MRVGEVVTDRGGASLALCVSGEETYRDGGGEETGVGAVGEVGDAGPGKGEEWRREAAAAPGLALRRRSTSACN